MDTTLDTSLETTPPLQDHIPRSTKPRLVWLHSFPSSPHVAIEPFPTLLSQPQAETPHDPIAQGHEERLRRMESELRELRRLLLQGLREPATSCGSPDTAHPPKGTPTRDRDPSPEPARRLRVLSPSPTTANVVPNPPPSPRPTIPQLHVMSDREPSPEPTRVDVAATASRPQEVRSLEDAYLRSLAGCHAGWATRLEMFLALSLGLLDASSKEARESATQISLLQDIIRLQSQAAGDMKLDVMRMVSCEKSAADISKRVQRGVHDIRLIYTSTMSLEKDPIVHDS